MRLGWRLILLHAWIFILWPRSGVGEAARLWEARGGPGREGSSPNPGITALSRLAGTGNGQNKSSALFPRTIPRVVHFIYGLDESNAPEFGFIQFLAVASAFASIKPDRIIMWHRGELHGEWWLRARPFVTDVRVARDVTRVFSNPVANYAHKADILRLEILIEFGGIYLDSDVVVWKSFDSLLAEECVIAQEGENGWVGLGNSVILAKPGARFLKHWLDEYVDFNDREWNRHSILLPRRLADRHPDKIRVLDHRQFLDPLWTEGGLQRMYTEKVHDFGRVGLANHLWESRALHFVLDDAANPDAVKHVDLPLYCAIRRLLDMKPPDAGARDEEGRFRWNVISSDPAAPDEQVCQILDSPLDNSAISQHYETILDDDEG